MKHNIPCMSSGIQIHVHLLETLFRLSNILSLSISTNKSDPKEGSTHHISSRRLERSIYSNTYAVSTNNKHDIQIHTSGKK